MLANKIGQNGVDAIRELGDASTELSAAAAQVNTEFGALAATLVGPVTRVLANLLGAANRASQAQRITEEGGEGAARLQAAGQAVFDAGGSADDVNLARQAEAAKIVEERRQAILAATRDAKIETKHTQHCLLYTSPSPRDRTRSRMPSSA